MQKSQKNAGAVTNLRALVIAGRKHVTLSIRHVFHSGEGWSSVTRSAAKGLQLVRVILAKEAKQCHDGPCGGAILRQVQSVPGLGICLTVWVCHQLHCGHEWLPGQNCAPCVVRGEGGLDRHSSRIEIAKLQE